MNFLFNMRGKISSVPRLAPAGQRDPAVPPADPRGPRRGRGRRPTQEVRDEIVAAAGRLLLTEGMAKFTIERVAALAGASKVTIYKWWSSKGVLAMEGYASTVDHVLVMPDTGDIGSDLTSQLVTFVRLLRDTPAGRVTAQLLGQAQTDPDLLAAFHRTYAEPRRAAGLAALRAAQERGQIRADVDLGIVIDQLWGACLYRLLVQAHPLTDDFARGVVQNILRGLH